MTTYPTETAWKYFTQHADDIRDCCERFLPVPNMQIPNSRIAIQTPDGTETVTDRRASAPLPIKHAITDFDAAVAVKDSYRLARIMGDTWLRAPESRRVYDIAGFSEMCALLDGGVEGFVDMGKSYDEDED